jgi:hypothetical protein
MGGVARALDNGSYEIRHIVNSTGMVSEVQVDEYSTDPSRPTGRTLRWRTRRDSHQRVLEVTDALGSTLRSEYDDDGEVTATYDDNNRLRALSMVQPAAAGAAAPTPTTLASYEYLGPTTVLNRTTGPVTVQHGFDDTGRTNALWLDSGAFRFDLDLRRDGWVKTSTRTTTTIAANVGAAPGQIVETHTWTYDSACRVETEQANFAATRTPQQLVTTRAYDGDGGVWDITFAATSAGVITNTALAQKIDARGRLIASNATIYRYDANGDLINDGKQSYFYDGWNLVEVRVNNQVTERYCWGRDPDEVIRAEINQQGRYIVAAPNGNVDSLFDANGNLIESYDYS